MGPPLPHNLNASQILTQVLVPVDLMLANPIFQCEEIDARQIFALEAQLRRLESRSLEPNALGGADFLLAACRHFPDSAVPRLLAVHRRVPGGPAMLAGLLPLRHGSADNGGVLRSWNHMFSVCGAPMIDAEHADAVLGALLFHLARNGAGPAALCLGQIALAGPFAAALQKACRRLDLKLDLLSPYSRAALAVPPEQPVWSRSRRKQRRRLSGAGETAFRVTETYAEVRTALETFLALEAGGWKGAGGTALISDPAHANFVRALVWSAARAGNVRIGELIHAGATIASVVMFTAGDRGFAWKIAHDETCARFSPGSLVMLELTDWLAARGDLVMVDSCASEGSRLVEPIWDHRLVIADAMVALRPAGSRRYRSALLRERLRRSLRARAKSIYHRLRGTGPAALAGA